MTSDIKKLKPADRCLSRLVSAVCRFITDRLPNNESHYPSVWLWRRVAVVKCVAQKLDVAILLKTPKADAIRSGFKFGLSVYLR